MSHAKRNTRRLVATAPKAIRRRTPFGRLLAAGQGSVTGRHGDVGPPLVGDHHRSWEGISNGRRLHHRHRT